MPTMPLSEDFEAYLTAANRIVEELRDKETALVTADALQPSPYTRLLAIAELWDVGYMEAEDTTAARDRAFAIAAEEAHSIMTWSFDVCARINALPIEHQPTADESILSPAEEAM